MSLFKEPFDPTIYDQLTKRQEIIGKEEYDDKDITYLNSKTAWISLKSSINSEDNSNLAKSNILLGGNGVPMSTNTNGKNHLLGMKPMSGITDVSIKNKGAYGSLRVATVNFRCWDVKQLEDLELLYMRPGFTVLLEWGWLPYIDNNGNLSNIINQDDDFFTRKDIDLQEYFKKLRSIVIQSNGNYDFMFGYVMNYSWKLRNDGGYDCSTEIISTGEILESYKINFSAPEINAKSYHNTGVIFGNTINIIKENNIIEAIRKDYKQNILRGLFSELFQRALADPNIKSGSASMKYVYKSTTYNVDFLCVDFKTDEEELGGNGDKVVNSISGDRNIYITLRDLVDLMNNIVLLKNPQNSTKSNIISLSVNDRIQSVSGNNEPLKCLYNPLQISVDPTVCLIKNVNFEFLSKDLIKKTPTETIKYNVIPPNKKQSDIVINLKNNIDKYDRESLKRILNNNINTLDDLFSIDRAYSEKYNDGSSFYDLLKKKLSDDDINNIFSNFEFPKIVLENNTMYLSPNQSLFVFVPKANQFLSLKEYDRKKYISAAQNQINIKQKEENQKTGEAISNLMELINGSEGNDFPHPDHINGIIGNIYINLKYLYLLANNQSLESQDRAEKNTIELLTFLRTMLRDIQSSIGNVNNFEIFIEDNIGYIIDLNLVDSSNSKVKPFEFQLNNRNSLIRDINIESHISSNQANIIAISAQSDAGKLGLDNSSMVAYNRGISDRMISKKDTILGNSSNQLKQDGFADFLNDLRTFFEELTTKPRFFNLLNNPSFNVENAGTYKNALRDTIAFYTAQYNPSNKYKAILPSKVSLSIDGIGGIIIGNVFDIDKKAFPSSYIADSQGAQLLYTITGISQNIDSSGKWITSIEGNPFISDYSFDKSGNIQLGGNIIVYDVPAVVQSFINDENLNPPPAYIVGDVKNMCTAINRVFGSITAASSGYCARYTYSIAKNFILARNRPQKELPGVVLAGGNANESAYHENLKKLGYKLIVNINNLSKADLKKRVEQSDQYQIGDIIVYWSNKPLIGNNNGYLYGHTQIFTGGIKYDSILKSNISNPSDNVKWACDRKYNYGYNFIYNSRQAIRPPESWNFLLFRL